MITDTSDTIKNTASHTAHRRRQPGWMRFVMPIIVVLVGTAISIKVFRNAPQASKARPTRSATAVRVITVTQSQQQVILEAMGSVVPACKIELLPRVSGEVQYINPRLIPGGIFTNGEELLRIDARDYELALIQQQGELARMEKDFALERGEQAMGKYYWKQIEQDGTNSELQKTLTLRQPQLNYARAAVAAAEAAVDKAKLELERTRIRAPFNALILDENVDPGAQVSPSSRLATLAGTDEYWVEAAVPLDRLKWMYRTNGGSISGTVAEVYYADGATNAFMWHGRVIRLLGQLGTEDRMARLLVSIKDPLGLTAGHGSRPPLLINSYVALNIKGKKLGGVIAIPRVALRENDTVWLASNDDTLEIRTVDPVWRGAEQVLIATKLEAGERLIISDMATPVAGMPVAIEP